MNNGEPSGNQENNFEFETLTKASNIIQTKSCEPVLRYEFIKSAIPLTLEDVACINITGDIRDNKSIYGLRFNKIMVYGYVTLWKTWKDFSMYHIDDGTGTAFVKYSKKGITELDLQKNILQLEERAIVAKRHGLPYLENNYKPKTKECREHLEMINSLIKLIKMRSNSYGKINNILELNNNGRKVAILGSPYKYNGKIAIYAYNMQIDNEPNRDIEINFKRTLIQWYRDKYINYSRNGTVKYF